MSKTFNLLNQVVIDKGNYISREMAVLCREEVTKLESRLKVAEELLLHSKDYLEEYGPRAHNDHSTFCCTCLFLKVEQMIIKWLKNE